MKISYFPEYTAKNAQPVLKSFLQGCHATGHTFAQNDMDADAVVIWSVLWNGAMASNERIYRHYRSMDCPVIVIDVGTLNRNNTWKVAINNVNAAGHYAHTANLDWDRPTKLNITLGNNTSTNPRIVIAGQHHASLQVYKLPGIEEWINDQITSIQQVTDRPITVRPHPRSRLDVAKLPKKINIELPRKMPGTYDSYDTNFDCHALVNYNSGPGICAALTGVRPIVDCTSLAHPVSVQLSDIENPYSQDRDLWLVEICHTEYTLQELENGLWATRLAQYL